MVILSTRYLGNLGSDQPSFSERDDPDPQSADKPVSRRLSPYDSAATAGVADRHGPHEFPDIPEVSEDEAVSDPAMLRLATLRSHDQYDATIYTLDGRYRGVFGGRMVVFMNQKDMQARGITEGDPVEIESLADKGTRRVVGGFWAKVHDIAAGAIGAYYRETNPLLPLAFHDTKSGTPAAKSIPVLVRLQPAQAEAGV